MNAARLEAGEMCAWCHQPTPPNPFQDPDLWSIPLNISGEPAGDPVAFCTEIHRDLWERAQAAKGRMP